MYSFLRTLKICKGSKGHVKTKGKGGSHISQWSTGTLKLHSARYIYSGQVDFSFGVW